jgi:Zn-dependent protease
VLQNLRRESWYIGDLAGIPIFVHWTVAFLAFSAWSSSGGGGLDGFIITIVALISGIVLHELGHGLMARRLGAFGLTITLWAFGGLCESRRDSARIGREIAIVAAGPLVSLALWLGTAYGLHALVQWWPALVVHRGDLTLLGEFLAVAAQVNLMLLIFNMLPIFPLDGGQLTYYGALLATRNQLLARQISLTLAVIGTLLVFLWLTGFFGALGSPDPVGMWMARMQERLVGTVMTIVLLGLILRSAFQHLR